MTVATFHRHWKKNLLQNNRSLSFFSNDKKSNNNNDGNVTREFCSRICQHTRDVAIDSKMTHNKELVPCSFFHQMGAENSKKKTIATMRIA